jgi:KDO2-lipid IV(A) lauroyltransferase
MDFILHTAARLLVAFLQALPLTTVARLGRAGGGAAYWLDARHRRVAMRNLQLIFGAKKSPGELRALARENFRRLGENYCCAVKTAAMSPEELRPHCEFVGLERLPSTAPGRQPESVVVAIGHFGNFELYARFGQFFPQYQCATTYRGLREAALNRVLQSLRERSGCLYFERRHDGDALRATMSRPGIMLGLLSDQRTGKGGALIPFMGRDCATTTAPAVFALRYGCPLYTAICYRIGLARWRVEIGPEIPTRNPDSARRTEEIMRDVNEAFAAAVNRDPANWFWVHNRWKPQQANVSRPKASPCKATA